MFCGSGVRGESGSKSATKSPERVDQGEQFPLSVGASAHALSECGSENDSVFRETPPESWVTIQQEIRDAIIVSDDYNEWEAPVPSESASTQIAPASIATNATGNASDNATKSQLQCRRRPPRLLAGCDISFIKNNHIDALSALVVLSYPELDVVYSSFRDIKLTEPYIPGFLAFREAQHILDLIAELRDKRPDLEPDCLLVDGNGLLHPRGCGLACQLGVLANMATIGIGKNLLFVDGLTKSKVKACLAEDGKEVGNDTTNTGRDRVQRKDLVGESGRTHGAAVAISGVSKPIYVSVGHKLSLDTAVAVAVASSRHRIPEPVRQADLLSRDVLRLRKDDGKN